MPRLQPSLLIKAACISPHVRTLVPATRDVESAVNELRWIREHVGRRGSDDVLSRSRRREVGGRGKRATGPGPGAANAHKGSHEQKAKEARRQARSDVESKITRLCRQRGAGVPLQYVLGSQPFGDDLEIRCRRGVLVPRWETEAWALHLERLLREEDRKAQETGTGGRSKGEEGEGEGKALRIVDFCTGTGCIALSLFRDLARRPRSIPRLRVLGVDVSPRAVTLARENLALNVRRGILPAPTADRGVAFERADVFDDEAVKKALAGDDDGSGGVRRVDVLVANPPYVSRDVWSHGRGQLGASVRKYEPRLALVPREGDDAPAYEGCAHEDVFYRRLLDVAGTLGVGMAVFEVGDEGQALRVARMALEGWGKLWKSGHDGRVTVEEVGIWRDWPDLSSGEDEAQWMRIEDVGRHHHHHAVVGASTGVNVEAKGSGNVRCVVVRFGR